MDYLSTEAEGNGTFTSTNGAVMVRPFFFSETPTTDLWLAAPPRVTEGSFEVAVHPAPKNRAKSAKTTYLVLLDVFIYKEIIIQRYESSRKKLIFF